MYQSRLTPEQIAQIRLYQLRWHGTLAPCGISHIDVFNPCLPEPWDIDKKNDKLWCLTCGLQQRLELK
jgi:hypothetical protein